MDKKSPVFINNSSYPSRNSDSACGNARKEDIEIRQNVIDIGADTHYKQQSVISCNSTHKFVRKGIVHKRTNHVGVAGIGLYDAHLPRKFNALDTGDRILPEGHGVFGHYVGDKSHLRKDIMIAADTVRSFGDLENLQITGQSGLGNDIAVLCEFFED